MKSRSVEGKDSGFNEEVNSIIAVPAPLAGCWSGVNVTSFALDEIFLLI